MGLLAGGTAGSSTESPGERGTSRSLSFTVSEAMWHIPRSNVAHVQNLNRTHARHVCHMRQRRGCTAAALLAVGRSEHRVLERVVVLWPFFMSSCSLPTRLAAPSPSRVSPRSGTAKGGHKQHHRYQRHRAGAGKLCGPCSGPLARRPGTWRPHTAPRPRQLEERIEQKPTQAAMAEGIRTPWTWASEDAPRRAPLFWASLRSVDQPLVPVRRSQRTEGHSGGELQRGAAERGSQGTKGRAPSGSSRNFPSLFARVLLQSGRLGLLVTMVLRAASWKPVPFGGGYDVTYFRAGQRDTALCDGPRAFCANQKVPNHPHRTPAHSHGR